MAHGHKILPKAGGWVLITDLIPTVIPVHRFAIYYAYPTGNYFFENELAFRIDSTMYDCAHPTTGEKMYRLFDVFDKNWDNVKIAINNYGRNKHHEFTAKQKELLDNETMAGLEERYPIEAQVKVITEYGTVCIQPHEYTLVDEEKLKEYFEYAKTGDADIVYLSKAKQLSGKIADQVFYMRSRGISFSDAIQLCIGSVTTANLLYLRMHPGYVEYFTREPSFTNYVNVHLSHMVSKGLKDEMQAYLKQVMQIEGYDKFKHKTIQVQSHK